MNRANTVDCSSTSVATYNQEFTARTPNLCFLIPLGSSKFCKVVVVCLALLFGILLAGLIALDYLNRRCMTGRSNFSSHIYCVSATMLTWNESRHSCAVKGAYLVIINSAEEQVSEKVWKWVDTGEPNDVNGIEDCAEMLTGRPSQENWNDFSCEEKKHYICEYEY
uniref:C-type lectin domain-containing protein n=1 Tax=Sinocyclocheilus anshuiensis TaxID=1608454 RepID=A0A671NSN6_9TELE